MKIFEYGGYYKLYNMQGDIKIGTGIVKVHDIFNDLPDFVKKADCLFIDPPCSNGNLKSFYTKNNNICTHDISSFTERLWECINIVNPVSVFIEVFKSNFDLMLNFFKKFSNNGDIKITKHTYYFNKKNICYIFSYSKKYDFNFLKDGIDEQQAIESICRYMPYKIIGDLCMGRGLVGFYANKYNRPFVGIEFNKKRLAVLVHRINVGKLNTFEGGLTPISV